MGVVPGRMIGCARPMTWRSVRTRGWLVGSLGRRPNGRWRARYRDANGREHARHFVEKEDAQQWLDGMTASVTGGRHVHAGAGRITFRAYAEEWRSMRLHR